MVPPGPASYFIYYRFDDKFDLKAQVNTVIPIRSQKSHFYKLPKSRSIPQELTKLDKKANIRKKDEIIDKFFTVFK